MSINNHIINLQNKHYELDEQLRQAYLSRNSDEEINKIKKKKLYIKEEILECADTH